MKASAFIFPLLASILIQLPLGYFFMSFESLVLGDGFIKLDGTILVYMLSILLVSMSIICLIGLPIYFLLKHFKLNTTLNVSVIGLVIPILILIIIDINIPHSSGFSYGENYYGTLRNLIENGVRTFWGWVAFFEDIVTYAMHGLVGATIFHKLYNRGNYA